jgi:[acyl-carrier-protein] S-malonyltransferase
MSLVELFPGQGGKKYNSKTPDQDLLKESLRNHQQLLDLIKGNKPKIIFGNSYGLYAALVAAGVITVAVALDLARRRAQIVEEAEDDRVKSGLAPTGMMSVIGKDVDYAKSLAEKYKLNISNYNGPLAHVLSGPRDLLEKAAEEVGVRARIMDIAGAYHDLKYRARDIEKYAPIVRRAPMQKLESGVVVVSSTDPRELKSEDDFREEMVLQMGRPVDIPEANKKIEQAGGEDAVDAGPGDGMQKIFQRITRMRLFSWERDKDRISKL